jgi:hypothetical protein
MSWFNRRPKIKEPVRIVHRRRGPATEKILEEAKKLGPSKNSQGNKDPNTTK